MWNCPKCNRNFKVQNQGHFCSTKDIGELFLKKPDELVVAFVLILQHIINWEPNTFGPSINTIVFTSKITWLIIRPMTKFLDIKFYAEFDLESELIHKSTPYGKKTGYHIRISDESQLTSGFFDLLKIGFNYSIK